MRFGSICSGIEAASVAWLPLGWTCAFVAEIQKFPNAVLKHHYPEVPNLGDMMATDFVARARACGPIDVLIAGTPCQSYSVAGLRESMSDARGNLTFRYLEILHELNPRFVVWENVPGILNTEDNAFGCFLAGMVGAEDAFVLDPYFKNKWPDAGVVTGPKRTLAWRVCGAEFHGLAQRRHRVFLISSRGPRNWTCAEALFPVSDGMPWHTPPSRKAWQKTTGTIASRSSAGGGLGTDFDLDGGLQVGFRGRQSGEIEVATAVNAHGGPHGRLDFDSETFIVGTLQASGKAAGSATQQDAEAGLLVAHALRGQSNASHRADSDNYVTHALRGEGFDASEDGTGRGTPLVPVAYRVHGENSEAMKADGVADVAAEADVARSLDTTGGYATNQGGNIVLQPAEAFQCQGGNVGPMGVLRGGNGNETGGVPFVVAIQERAGAEIGSGPDGAGFKSDGLAYTLEARQTPQAVAYRTRGDGGAHDEGDQVAPLTTGTDRCGSVIAFDTTQVTSAANRSNPKDGDPCHPLAAGAHPPAVAFQTRIARNGRDQPSELVDALTSSDGGIHADSKPHVAYAAGVRRLLPVECEKLQGFPPGYTNIPGAKDGPRYKSLGNSFPVPVIQWLGKRLEAVKELDLT